MELNIYFIFKLINLLETFSLQKFRLYGDFFSNFWNLAARNIIIFNY